MVRSRRPQARTWVYDPQRALRQSHKLVPPDLQQEVQCRAQDLIDSTLKPRHIQPPSQKPQFNYSVAGSADHRSCGRRLFGPVMERSNSCVRIGGHSHAVDDQTAASGLFLGAHAGVFVVT